MRLSLSATSVRPVQANVARPSRRSLVPQASLKDIGGGILQDFAQIFSPLRKQNKEDWNGTETPFTAKISHHSDTRRPFKDGWQAAAAQPDRGEAQAAQAAPEAGGQGVLGFINKAAESVIAHNFTGDSEPAAWKDKEVPASGWTSDIHSRNREGFHSINPVVYPAKKAAAASADSEQGREASPTEQTPTQAQTVLTFLTDAAENVVAHNFTGDATEPEHWKGKGEKGHSGWKGDIHTKERDGFHSL